MTEVGDKITQIVEYNISNGTEVLKSVKLIVENTVTETFLTESSMVSHHQGKFN